jgi:hypothetical protein
VAGDPKQCREYALQCSELARKAKNPAHKQMLNDLAQTWFSLAHDIEHSRAVLDSYPP